MAQEHIPDERIITAKFAGPCTECGYNFPQGTFIKFNTHLRTKRHVECPVADPDLQEGWQKTLEVMRERMKVGKNE